MLNLLIPGDLEKIMKPRMKIWIAALISVLVALSCNLPARNPEFMSPTATSQAETSQPGGVTKVSDFSQVRLELADLPQGFNPVSENDMAQFGLNLDSLLASISAPLAKAEPQNLAAYSKADGVNTTLVISFILQPLTLLERGAFDLLVRDPQNAVNLLANIVSDLTFHPLINIESIGDAVLGTTFSYEKATIPIDGELVISRRDQVIQVAMVASLRGGAKAVDGLQIARIIDGKIQAALK
jgi:hypothetical protein